MSPDSRPERDKRVVSRVQSEDLKPGAESEGTRSRKGWAVKKPKAKSRGGGPKKAIRRGEKAAQSPSTFAKATADKTADRKPKGQRGKPGEITKSENKGTPPDKLRTNKPRPGGASRGPGKGGRRGKA